MILGKGAVGPLREALIGDVESAIEARAEVLPGDHRRQLHQLCVGETLTQARDLLVRRSGGGGREGDSVVEDSFLELVEGGALLVAREIPELLFAETVLSADGRVDIESEHTADHGGCLQTHEILVAGL